MHNKTTNPVGVATSTGFTKPFNLRPEKAKNLFHITPSPIRAQQKRKQTIHNVYNRLISILEARLFESLPFVLHERVKRGLLDEYRIPVEELEKLENSIIRDTETIRRSSSIPRELYRELAKIGKTELIFSKRIVLVPDDDLNVIVCEKLEKEFSRSTVLSCPGFVLRDGGYVQLDLNERLSERGFMMPVIPDRKVSIITGLQIFRSSEDEYPFILRSRNNGGNYAC